ncbi:MAG: FkbM family methyltransferase [Thermoleophilaceae bacterium]
MPLAGIAPEGEPFGLTIVMPVYNELATLRHALDRLLAVDMPVATEVLVVDDGSTDGSAEVVERLAQSDVRLRLVRQANSGHPAVVRNNGIRDARGDLVLCMDADDRIPPEFLDRCVATLDAHPEAGVAYTDQQDFGASDRYHAVREYDFRALTQKNQFGNCSLFRRRAWEDAGGWDVTMRYNEDWDFFVGCGDTGHHGVKAHSTAWHYRVHEHGRYAESLVEGDRDMRARFVLKRPHLYTEAQRAWAEGILAGDERWLAVPDEFGIVPADPGPAEAPAEETSGARSFSTVILADEAITCPDLLSEYASVFGADDDATLVIYAPDAEPEAVGELLLPLLGELGLDGEHAPDMMALAVPASQGDGVLAGSAAAVLSRSEPPLPFASLPRFDSAPLTGLRELAERRWAPPAPAEPTAPGSRLLRARGAEMEVPADMLWAFEGDEYYEGNVIAWFERLLERDEKPVFYDVGANFGHYSALASTRTRAVYSFEPVPGTHELLARNLRRNGLDARHAFQLGLAAAPGSATINVYNSSGCNSLYQRDVPADHPLTLTGSETIELVRLDTLVESRGLPAPTVVKVDVEGGELGFLHGACETLMRHRPAILMEYSEATCRDAGYEREELVHQLVELGYDVYGLADDPSDLTLYPLFEFAGRAVENLIAVPAGEPAPVMIEASVQEPSAVPGTHERFREDLAAYQAMSRAERVEERDLNPQLSDYTDTTPYDGHYFFQDIWAARRVAELHPARHVDVGSRVDYVGFLTAITDVVFVDIRPLDVELDNFTSVAGSALEMPFEDQSVESLSCLHVIEHIGLGRYGDPLDPDGLRKALREFQRVVAPGGQLLVSTPVGRRRTCFNAHRISDPYDIPALLPELELVEFSGVDDSISFRRHRSLDELVGSNYACGMYRFVRPHAGQQDTPPYEGLINPGDLVFDVGANEGNRVETFLGLGARVVAVEPQADCAARVRARWTGNPRISVVEKAASASEGTGEIYRGSANTLTTMARDWIDNTQASGRFAGYEWGEAEQIATTTLDRLIQEHGVPAFCKIDVEGFEDQVLAGLSRPIPAVSIEFASESLAKTESCIARLASLGMTEFNYSLGESMQWASAAWLDAASIVAALRALPAEQLPWGDVYARMPTGS